MKSILIFLSAMVVLVAMEPIIPLPQSLPIVSAKALLGKKLFFDTRLSADDTIACASCHIIKNGGDDDLPHSFGIQGKEGAVNAPTVLNAVFNFRQFWDGRAKDLQEQAGGPIENPIEMGYNFPDLIKKLNQTEYKKHFQTLYPEGITKETITHAIAEYEKTLITPNAPFDRYLLGDEEAITQNQKEGYELFKSKGCISCHHGINVGGNLYNKFGVISEVTSSSSWLGRYEVTKKKRDKHFFKVPSLRNVVLTAPYFHDGSESSLKETIKTMALVQLGRKMQKGEIDKIADFLASLSGTLPPEREIYVP